MNYEKIYKKLNRYDYISFDIFDTLIIRNCEKPVDVFRYIEKYYKVKDFCINRINAEIKTRSQYSREVSLSEIYDNLSINSKTTLNELMELEEKIEIDMCSINPIIIPLIKYCETNKKHIIITTDMYLPKEVIKKILDNNKIPYEKIYLSCELQKSKADKSIFKHIKEDLKINGKDIIHLGDNIKSDFINPIVSGIKAIRIKKTFKKLCHYSQSQNIEQNIFNSFIQKNINNEDYFYKNGFSILGPLLYYFCTWLKEEVQNQGTDEILFLSRDGLIIKKAYEKLYGKEEYQKYFYASRRALIVPSLKYYSSLEEMLENMYLENETSLKNILNCLGIDVDNDVLSNAQKNDIDIEKKIKISSTIKEKDKYYHFLYSYIERVYQESELENKAIIKYLDSLINQKGNQKVAVVDIGWFGNMQKALEKIIHEEGKDITLFGYYVGMNPNNRNQKKYYMKGYLFDSLKNQAKFETERRFNSVFETMFTANHASLKKYIYNNNELSLVFKENDNVDKDKIISEYQNAALDFVEKFKSFTQKIDLELDKIDIYRTVSDFGVNPTLEDAIHWGNLRFDSGTNDTFIAKPHAFLFYFLNPKNLYKDLKKSYWKHGFLKRLLRIRINYDKIYDILKKTTNNDK